MEISKCAQQSEEWFTARSLCLTASHAQAIANQGKGLETYITEIMAYHFSSEDREHFSNAETDRGNELEPLARTMYELESGEDVEQVGYIKDGDYVLCSPDGLIGEDGGIEIKSPNTINYYKILRDGEKEIESKYIWQVQMNLLVSKRKWWNLVYYNPNFEKSLITFKILPDAEKQEALRVGLAKGIEMIKNQLKVGEKIISDIEKNL